MYKPQPAISEVKGLARATKPLKIFSNAVKHLQSRNNIPVEEAHFSLILFIGCCRMVNIRFTDLQISEFKPISERSSKNYALLVMCLYIQGNAAKSNVIRTFGIAYTTTLRMIRQMIDHGYIEVIQVKAIKTFNGSSKASDVEHLQLTSKGYDLANRISVLLIDDRLI